MTKTMRRAEYAKFAKAARFAAKLVLRKVPDHKARGREAFILRNAYRVRMNEALYATA